MENFQEQFDSAIDKYATGNMFGVSKIPAHAHNGVDSFRVDEINLVNKAKFILYRIVDSTVTLTTGTGIGGDFVTPFEGYVQLVGATVDTAGTTNDTTINILKNGTSILSTKVTINSASKTSRTATVPSIINGAYFKFLTGDVFTFNIDTVSTTAPKGLTVFINAIIP